MNRFRQPKSFDNYFDRFENKSKRIARLLKRVFLAGLGANVLLVILLATGIIHRPRPVADPHPVPAPEPVHIMVSTTSR